MRRPLAARRGGLCGVAAVLAAVGCNAILGNEGADYVDGVGEAGIGSSGAPPSSSSGAPSSSSGESSSSSSSSSGSSSSSSSSSSGSGSSSSGSSSGGVGVVCSVEVSRPLCEVADAGFDGAVNHLAANDAALYTADADGVRKRSLDGVTMSPLLSASVRGLAAPISTNLTHVYVLNDAGSLSVERLAGQSWVSAPLAGSFQRLLPAYDRIGVITEGQDPVRACRMAEGSSTLCYSPAIQDPALFGATAAALYWFQPSPMRIYEANNNQSAGDYHVSLDAPYAFAASGTFIYLAQTSPTAAVISFRTNEWVQRTVLAGARTIRALFADGPVLYWSEHINDTQDQSFRCVSLACAETTEPLGSGKLVAFSSNNSTIFFALEGQNVKRVARSTPQP